MSNDQSNQVNKRTLRDAQARHQSALFGDQPVQKPSSQRAETESRNRGQALSQAAAQKRQQLTAEEEAQLAELQARNQAARSAATVPPGPRQSPPQSQSPAEPAAPVRPTAPPTAQIHEAVKRSDLAAAAVTNMQRNLRTQRQSHAQPSAHSHAPTPPQPTTEPSAPPPPPSTQPPAPPLTADRPAPSRPPARRAAPTPEELDRLLREMAQRSAARRAAGGAPPPGARPRPSLGGRPGLPGAEGIESAPAVEAPPEPPPEVKAEEEKSAEKQAEILKELKAREAAAQRDITPIPQADQERAAERPVEATVPIRTEGNAVSAAPLHDAIAELQTAMRAHDAPGQVAGVNHVQRNMPHHPLYQPDDPSVDAPPEESHGA